MPSFNELLQRVTPGLEFHQNRYARALDDAVSNGCRWLDIGAGTKLHHGWIGPSESETVAKARLLVGCDVVLEHIAQNTLLTAAVGANAQHLPFADDTFDLVSANMVLEHLSEPEAVFSEIARVLAPGGRFIFVTPNVTHPVVFLSSILLSRPARRALAQVVEGRSKEHVFYTFYKANSPRAIRKLVAGRSLEPRTLERFASYPFARRPWPLIALEMLWIRLTRSLWGGVLCSNILGELQKPAIRQPG
jgi:ubiquinone/menaquinone biosynthesis C-methylase UbiE